MRRTIVKQPAESFVVELDFAPLLGAAAVASIASTAVAARGLVAAVSPLAVGAQAVAGQAARLRLDAGDDGERYLVTCRIAGSDATTHELEAEVAVADLGFTAPDGSFAYASIADFVERFGLEAAVRLTDELGTGRIDRARIAAAIADATAFADGWLASRYAVPLSAPSPVVKAAVLDLAFWRMHRLEAPEGVRAAGEAALQALRWLGEGRMQLAGATPADAAPASAAPVLFDGAPRLITPDTLKGW